ncbi:MAG: hypothetical protein U0414_13005 [Polyangiaceae bacterium]
MKTQKKSSYVAAVAALLLVGAVGASACGSKSAAEVCKSLCDKSVECAGDMAKEMLGGKDIPEEALKSAKEEAGKHKQECVDKCGKEADGGRASASDVAKLDECLAKSCKDFMACMSSLK